MIEKKQYHAGSVGDKAFELADICENPWNSSYRPKAFAGLQTDFKNGALHVYLEATEPRTALRAEATMINGRVWEDSCLEFFVNPVPEQGLGYLNFEANSRGVMLFGVHNDQFSGETTDFCEADFAMHTVHTFLPDGMIRWSLSYRIPFSYFQRWFPAFEPKPGMRIAGNFYKCGDLCPQEHYLTWSPIAYPTPSFHRPECFGDIIL